MKRVNAVALSLFFFSTLALAESAPLSVVKNYMAAWNAHQAGHGPVSCQRHGLLRRRRRHTG